MVVEWWDRELANPPEDVIYPIPHLIYSHDTGVVDFCVDEACCKRLASYLEHPDSYSNDGWLFLAGKEYPGYSIRTGGRRRRPTKRSFPHRYGSLGGLIVV